MSIDLSGFEMVLWDLEPNASLPSLRRPGVPVLLRDLLDAHLQGVQHGPSHGPHLCVSARRRAGLSGHHHPAAGRRTAGTPGGAGEKRNGRKGSSGVEKRLLD